MVLTPPRLASQLNLDVIMSDMGLTFKHCLILMFSLWQVVNLTKICSEVCECSHNVTTCQKCSYNLTVEENSKSFELYMCCNNNVSDISTQYGNRTFSQVTAHFSECNSTSIELDIPFIKTYALIVQNTSFSKIKLKNKNIQEIDFSLNKLQYITKGIFTNFSYLKKLILCKNDIISIFEDSFTGLSKLETLDLSENKLTVLTNVFTPLKNLQHLNLSRNNIEFIHENYFNNWLLQHLDVSHNNLRKLAPGALQLLPNLARLLLTDNPHLGITQLDTQLLVGTGRRLQQIDASRTGLHQVPEAFTHSVRFLSLIGNRISSLRCGDLDSYPLLQSLDFSNNNITIVEDDSLGRLEMLLFLNLNRNYLTTVPKSMPDELKYLSINSNMLKNLSRPDFKNLPNLRVLLLQSNKIQYIEDHVFDDLLSLEMLDLSNNPIQALSTSTFEGPLSLRDLRLCYLNMSMADLGQDGSFPMSAPESVQMLHLQASPGLARQLLADSAALAAFTHLQYLDLRMNNLTHIRDDLLFYLVQLKTLRLHGNYINCTAEAWLKDWMNGNKSESNTETCYYSSSEAKPDIVKYNCTFTETFTISESLPPVNLYSTEMINKLLRYYGYLSNKTDKASNRANFNYNTKNNIAEQKMKKEDIKKTSPENYFQARNENKILMNDYFNETFVYKARVSSKILDQKKVQNDQQNIDRKFLAIESHSSLAETRNIKEFESVRLNKSGHRLNTPVNMISKLNATIKGTLSLKNDENGTSSDRGEFSRLTSDGSSEYVGGVAVCVLVLVLVVVWGVVRARGVRGARGAPGEDAQEQMEVASISGGTLW